MAQFIIHIPKNILKNLTWISFGDGSGVLLFYLANVYLARVMGSEVFGQISFAFAFLPLAMIFSDIGLPMYGIREVSRKGGIQEISNNIISTRLFFSIAVFFVASLIVLVLPAFYQYRYIIIATFMFVIPYSMGIDWAFRGLEKMQYSALWTFIQYALFFLGVLLIVKTDSNILSVPILRTFAVAISSATLIVLAYRKFGLRFELKRPEREIMKASAPFMISSLLSTIFLNLDSICLGIMDTPESVGIYNAACRIYILFIGIISALYLAYAPVFSRSNKDDVKRVIKDFSKTIHIIAFPVSFMLLTFSKEIIITVYGIEYGQSATAMNILSLSLLFSFLSLIYLSPLLFAGFERSYLLSVLAGNIINALLNILLIPVLSYNGAALASLVGNFTFYLTGLFLFHKAFSPDKRVLISEVSRTVLFFLGFGAVYFLLH